ncbi:hypothetical protein CASFOL_009282 [Castilleja foliolosa]|uniref:SWIM-type domain-containing protein n=1 Tax=Castilleja foliolosa TaxID=1961234 RepID=A0ABD3E0V0_9LAMI
MRRGVIGGDMSETINAAATAIASAESRGPHDSVQLHDDGVTAYDVVFSSSVNTLITCSCKMFEECGLLCRHCLRIFHMHSVQKIPDCYIKRRWTKFAKEALWDRREYWFLDWCHRVKFATK